MISINKVRNTVLFLLAKNNRGFISPQQFDAYSDLAQRDLFENLFYRYNKWINNSNNRLSNTGFADIPSNIQEQIDVFSMYSTPSNFTYSIPNDLWTYTGNDFYRTGGLSLKNAQGKQTDLEEVLKGEELNRLINSTINAPTITYPIYVKLGDSFRVYPKVPSGYTLELFYVRVPKTPKWTYVEVDGNPVYNAGAGDKQDFELNEAIFPLLVSKILAYCGISVKDIEVAQIAASEETLAEQKQE